jgi:cytidylate kinase
MAVITISRQVGSGSQEIATQVAKLLGRRSEAVAKIATRKRDSTGAEVLTVEKLNEASCVDLIRTAIQAAHRQGNFVILGRGGQAILKDKPDLFHVRITAPLDVRVRRIQAEHRGFSAEAAEEWAAEQDRKTAAYLKQFFGIRWDDPLLYHMVINTGKIEPWLAARFIANAVTQSEPTPAV